MLVFALSACGGGSQKELPPIVEPAWPFATSVSPAFATTGVATVFTVTGMNLRAGLIFSLDNCDGTTGLAGGTNTSWQFRCTPNGAYGAHSGSFLLNSSPTSSILDFKVDFQSPVFSFDNSAFRNAVVMPDGRLIAWGASHDQGDGGENRLLVPATIGPGYASVSVGWWTTHAIKKDGTLWAWGMSSYGALGTGTGSFHVALPVQIGTDYKKVVSKGENSDEGEYAVGLKNDGSLWVWGARTSATPNSLASVEAPRMIGSGYSDIASGQHGDMLALKADGSLWQFQRNPSNAPFAPVKIADGYVAVTTSFFATFALKADGTLWNWGPNAANKPATGEATAAAPVMVGSGFKAISSGEGYTMAIKTDGTLWAGGSAGSGQFGDSTVVLNGAFRQVGSGYIAVSAGDTCTVAQKPDGTLWAWGLCQFGDGAEPVQSVARKIPLV